MISPSIFLTASEDFCGKPGAAFVREMQRWRRPVAVFYPTIRRTDWRNLSEARPGEAPSKLGDSTEEQSSFRTAAFLWARTAWRGFLAPQLDAIITSRRWSFDARECHPFTLGYVRGAIWELLERGRFDEIHNLSAFIAISATADVFGLDWVDDIEDAIDDLKGCGTPPESQFAFQEGVRRGLEEMELYLDELELTPRRLADWFEADDSDDQESDSETEAGFDAQANHGRTGIESDVSFTGDSE